MPLALFKPKDRATHPMKQSEQRLSRMGFTVHKFNNRPKPSRDKILIISCLSEFGCEVVGCMYCLPRLLKRFPGRYIIILGWYGREYLYRHLADEFWEMKEEHMWLRNHTYAFHHVSDNLKRLEQSAAQHGSVFPSSMLGKFLIGNLCRTCGKLWNEWRVGVTNCPSCKSTYIVNSVFSDVDEYKKTAVRIPRPSAKTLDWADSVVDRNSVGVFARGRQTYGRNLPPDFYVRLIELLKSKGFNAVWLGEKQSTLACPVPEVYDFSRSADSRDLEKTLAIISRLRFTIQFWTASSRLAGMMGVPYLLIESPEQIYCTGYTPGQEGKRLDLTTFGPRKLVLSHYLNVLQDQNTALANVERAIAEMEKGNWDDMIGQVEDYESTKLLQQMYTER